MRDLVERQKAIEAMSESLKRVFPEHRQIAEKCLNALPSVTPKQERGKWEEKAVSDEKVIDEWQSARCSACGKYHTAPYMYYFNNYNYCPNCGARMTKEDV